MTPAEVASFRSLLEDERAKIALAIEGFRQDGLRNIEDELGLPGGVGADTASVTFERELGEGLGESAQLTLEQIDHALDRLAEGTYGLCEVCGKPIDNERLVARPSATLCIEDQRRAAGRG